MQDINQQFSLVTEFNYLEKKNLLETPNSEVVNKWSDPGHFLKSHSKLFLSFLCTLFYIFLTSKNYKLRL